jgi:hypothetical protein
MMTEPIDFTPLRLSDRRRDVIVASVLLQSGHELTRRASGSSPIVFLGTWARPTLAAAAVLAAVCGALLTRTPEQASVAAHTAPGAGIAEALGVSSSTTALLAAHSVPTMNDVLLSVEDTR